MLVLARKPDQAILLGDGIRIVVLGVSGDRVRIGIEAPRDVPILRQELRDAVEESNRAAGAAAALERWQTLQSAFGKREPAAADAEEHAA
ncbi:MAG TPA: carbon storage regulator [Thermomicrobiales bacterium]|nr:carbon storage regulator [Thermomicrobiales bacterium]